MGRRVGLDRVGAGVCDHVVGRVGPRHVGAGGLMRDAVIAIVGGAVALSFGMIYKSVWWVTEVAHRAEHVCDRSWRWWIVDYIPSILSPGARADWLRGFEGKLPPRWTNRVQ